MCIKRVIKKILENNSFPFSCMRSRYFSSVFSSIGAKTSFGSIELLLGAKYITVGDNCSFDNYLYMTAWESYREQSFNPSMRIGNNCHLGAFNHLSCINKITIGDNCLTGKWVTITDNSHGRNTVEELSVAPGNRLLYSKGPVIIGKNVWIGDKATILPGVTIGDNAVIAANSVVTKDIPTNSVAGGNPAKVLKNVDKSIDILL